MVAYLEPVTGESLALKVCIVFAFLAFSAAFQAATDQVMIMQEQLSSSHSSNASILDKMHESVLILKSSENQKGYGDVLFYNK